MIALFKQKSPANIIILLIFGLLIKMPMFLYPKNIQATQQDGKLYHFLLSGLPAQNGFVCSAMAFLLLYVQALLLNYLINEQRLTNRQTYLPAMAFLLITSLFSEWSYFSAPLIASALIIWIFIKLFKLYNAESANGIIYNIGLILGIGSFIFFPSIAFVFCVLLGVMILRPFRINDIVILLFGALTPYYFYAVYLFLTDRFVPAALLPQVNLQIPVLQNTLWLAIAVVLLGAPFLMGGYYIQTLLRKMLIQVRKNWSIMLLFLLLALAVPFISATNSLHNWLFAAAPFATFHSCAYLYPKRQWVSFTLFFLTLAFIITQQYILHNWQ